MLKIVSRARATDGETFTRTGKGVCRAPHDPAPKNVYPTDPAAIRRLNTVVNNQHARLPKGWESKGDCNS